MIFFWIFVIFILLLGIFNYFISENVTGNKRIVEITKEDGSTFYRCEKETSKGHWIPILKYISYNDYEEDFEEAIYNNIDDALKYIGKHPSQITKSEKIIEI